MSTCADIGSCDACVTSPGRKATQASRLLVGLIGLAMLPAAWLALIAGTFVSEDLTCITAGQLMRSGTITPAAAIGGCFLGVYLGDLGLWLLGRLLGPRVLRWRSVAKRLTPAKLLAMEQYIDRHTAAAVFASRLIPGTRLPTYVAAGALGRKGGRFAFYTFIACAIWVPAIVLGVAWLGIWGIVGALLWIVARWIIRHKGTEAQRNADLGVSVPLCRIRARIQKLWRWEFWPSWLFYLPVVPYIAWLSLKHRSFAVITAANPAMPHGGFVGESKLQIYHQSRDPHLLPTVPVDGVHSLPDWGWPLVLKPDVGQRGAGVKLAHGRDDAARILMDAKVPMIAQPYHPGPFEAGIFYVRHPDWPAGRMFSITDKHFPAVTGDGESTLEQLIWRHPRYRMQAGRFLKRHDGAQVLAAGETLPLAIAGNHCQGTLFRDGEHLITPDLESAVDRIARSFPHFHFGRLDVRYRDVDRFRAGEDLAVIEINGITSESTNLYDPSWSLWRAYRTLSEQWRLLFDIAAANCRHGHRGSTLRQLVRDVIRYYRSPRASDLAD